MIEKNLSVKNTKGEILDAYHEALNRLKEREKDSLKPEKIKEEKRKEEVVVKANEMTTGLVTENIQQLRGQFNKALTELSEKLQEEADKYAKLQEAIGVKNQEMKEIYDVEKEAQSLAALLEAQKEKREKLEMEIGERKRTFDEEIASIREQWQNEKTQYQLTQKELEVADKKKRDREIEEFQYQFKRDKEQAQNKLADELIKQKKEFSEENEQRERDLNLREQSITERDQQVREREKKVKDLETTVATFDTRMENAVEQAVKETSERLKIEYEAREALLKKQFEGEINVMKIRVETLSNQIVQQKVQIDQQTVQLDKSYKKVEEIAIKALDSSSSGKVMTSIEQLLKENTRSRTQD